MHVHSVVCIHITADNHLLNACVDDEALAHRAGVCVRHDLSGGHIAADQVQRRADHLVTRSGNNGVHLRMHRAAEFVSFAARNAHLLTNAGADVDAVGTTSRRTVVAGGYDDVVLDDDRAKVAAQTGATLECNLRHVEVVVCFVPTVHFCFLLLYRKTC